MTRRTIAMAFYFLLNLLIYFTVRFTISADYARDIVLIMILTDLDLFRYELYRREEGSRHG